LLQGVGRRSQKRLKWEHETLASLADKQPSPEQEKRGKKLFNLTLSRQTTTAPKQKIETS